jgi:hypothetical protein
MPRPVKTKYVVSALAEVPTTFATSARICASLRQTDVAATESVHPLEGYALESTNAPSKVELYEIEPVPS